MGKRGKHGRRGNGEGTIYERANGTYAATFTLAGGKRRTLYAKTYKEAQEKLKRALYEQQQGTLVTAAQQTVAQYLTDWLEHSQKQSVRPRTYERYEEIARLHIIPALGRHKLHQLSAQHVQAFYTQKLEAGLSALTVISFHNLLHKALDTAVRWGLVARNVCDAVSPPRRRRFEVKPLTLEQVQRLLAAVEDHRLAALFKLALATGMRRGELLGLKWQDIDLAKGTLQVRRVLSRIPSRLPGKGYAEAEPKTQRSRRTIVIAPFALSALKEHRARQLGEKERAGAAWQEHDFVFCTPLGTHLNPTRDMLDLLKAFLKRAGLPDIRFHDLRHSSATLLLSLGVHPKVVQEILGHSQISMTLDIYSHVLPGMHQDAMARLNAALAVGGSGEGGTQEGQDEVLQ
ncbi:MAG TPA: site-specific integrase [Ktedonobacteraceae bacterium]|nr:site-specific integrase [Ktedonobacteraceae bacterium]